MDISQRRHVLLYKIYLSLCSMFSSLAYVFHPDFFVALFNKDENFYLTYSSSYFAFNLHHVM